MTSICGPSAFIGRQTPASRRSPARSRLRHRRSYIRRRKQTQPAKNTGSQERLEHHGARLILISRRNTQQAGAAQALLRKAITADPNSSAAFALSSFVATLGVHQGWHARQAVASWVLHAAERAIALDDQDPWNHVAAGYAELFIANQPKRTPSRIFKRALSLNPNVAMAQYLIALASTYIDEPEAAFEHADLAEQLGPVRPADPRQSRCAR